MPVKFNTDNQRESDSEGFLPLFTTFLKSRPDLKDFVFGINEFKLSKNEEWLICSSGNDFVVLLSVDSKQYRALQTLLQECQQEECALVGMFDKTMKSNMAFGMDEETIVRWKDTENGCRYAYNSANHAYNLPSPPTVREERPKRGRRKPSQETPLE
jgi:hypothetical protein